MLIGMEWKIIFDDGQSIAQKIGRIEKQDISFVYIRTSENNKLQAIPIQNIKRMEKLE